MKRPIRSCGVALALGICLTQGAMGAVSFTGSYSETFDSLPNSGTAATGWTNDSTLPGWSLFKRPAPGSPLASITPGTGSSNAGAIYSFGGSGEADRALGGVGSGGTYWGSPSTGTVAGWIAVALTNGTNSLIDSVTLAFDGEQWRDGGNTSAQTMVLEYGIGASFEAVAWTAPAGNFDFVSPIHSAAAALDGNDPANRVAGLGGSLSGLPWGVGETLWVRWIENNDAGNDHGLAVDNISVTSAVVEPPTDDADFNADGTVDGADFLAWQRGFGAGSTLAEGNANGDGTVDAADLEIWKAQYGQSSATVAVGAVPEPSTCLLGAIGLAASLGVVRRRS